MSFGRLLIKLFETKETYQWYDKKGRLILILI
jgi:hypothetical protein